MERVILLKEEELHTLNAEIRAISNLSKKLHDYIGNNMWKVDVGISEISPDDFIRFSDVLSATVTSLKEFVIEDK